MSQSKKMNVRQWALVERDQQGKKTLIELTDAQLKLVVKQGHSYALIEKANNKPVAKVTLKRKGDSLLIVGEDEEILVDLEKYYSEEAVSWSHDASFSGVDIARALPLEGVAVAEAAAAPAALSALQWGMGGVVAGVLMGQGGGGSSAPAPTPTNQPFNGDGELIDDYIAYAQVFADLNGNGRWDQGEPLTQTDAKGQFKLAGIVAKDVNLVAVGGIDIASGVPNNIVYRFNLSGVKDLEGSDLVISPISTLITAIAEAMAEEQDKPITADTLIAAAEMLSGALNLNVADPSVLLNFDAVQAAYASVPSAAKDLGLEILSLSRQISVVVAAAGALINGADDNSTNVGTVVAARAIAQLLIDGEQEQLDFTNALDVETMVKAAMLLANETQVTDGLKATTPADLKQISQILSGFNLRIEQATEQETNGISADSLAAMVAVNDLMVPLLLNSGSEAASEREGDISLATILMQFKDVVALEESVADYVDGKITAQKNSVIYAFGSVQSVAGYVDDYVPLGIQLPAMAGGKIVDKVYLDLAELAAQKSTSNATSANVEVFRFDPLSQQFIELEYSVNNPTLEVSPQHVGYLYVRTNAPLVAAKINGIDVFKDKIEIPVRATFTEGGQTASFFGELNVEIRNRPLDLQPKITSVMAEAERIDHNSYTNNNDDPEIRGVLNQNLPAGDEGRYYSIEIYEDSRKLGEAVVDANDPKKWSFVPEGPLSDGVHTYTARITFRQPNGTLITLNSGSLAYTITVDTVAPDAPAFKVDAERVFEGTAEAGTTVTIVRKAPSGSQGPDEVLATVRVDQDGQWTYAPKLTDNIRDGDKFYAYTTDEATNRSPNSSVLTVIPGGSNSEPVVVAAEDVIAVEGDEPIRGQLEASDPDGDKLTFSLRGAPIDGLTLNADGSWTFDTASANLDFLGEGEEYPLVVTYVVTDQWGGEDSSSFTIMVKGTTPSILSVEPGSLRAVAAPAAGDTVTLEFTVSRDGSRESSEEEVVAWTLTGLSAADFDGGVLPSGTVNFAQGSNTAIVSVQVPASLSGETLRQAVLKLETPGAGYVIDAANKEATMTLIDSSAVNDGVLVLTVSADQPVKMQEGAQDEVSLITYTVRRSGDPSAQLEIGYRLDPVGAALVSGQDFAGADGDALPDLPTGALRFASGESEATITLRVRGDDAVGPLESFNLVLTGLPSGARVQGQTYGEINNDDVFISVAPVSIEGATEGEVTHRFVVTRSGATEGTHTVYYTLQGVGEQASELFSGSGRQALVFEAGETEKTIELESFEAQTIAGFQTFSIELEAAPGDNVTLVNAKAVAGIIANLQDVELGADIDRIAEGSSTAFAYTVTRSGATDKALTLKWSVEGSGENAAVPADFEGSRLPEGEVTFAAGETTATITFKTRQDAVLEGDQGFALKLDPQDLPPGVRLLTPQQEGFVVDDESAVGFAPESAFSVVEGDDGSSNLMVEVTRIGFTGNESTVEWRVSPGTAVLSDFAPGQDALGNNGGYPSGVLTLLPGEALGSVAIRIAGDTVFENGLDETLSVTLSNPSAGTLLLGQPGAVFDGYGTTTQATIVNDDSKFSVVTSSVQVTEGQGGTNQDVAITIRREGSLSGSDWVKWSLTSTGAQGADNEDLGQDNSAVAVFNSYQQSWIDIAELSGTQSASGTISLPKSGYIMVAYNRDLEFEDYDTLNTPFDQFLLKNLSISDGATITSLGSVMNTNFVGDDLEVGEGGVLFSSEEGRPLPGGMERQITLTADGDLRGLYFKVVGYDQWDNYREEYVKGSNGGSVATSEYFAKVTEVSVVPAKVAIGSLYPAQDYYEEHTPDEYFDDLEIKLDSGQLFNTGDSVSFGVYQDKQGARWETDGDTTYLTLTSDADLTGIDFLVTGGILIAKFDETTNSLDQEFITSSPSYEQAEVPGGAKIRAEQLSGLYQGEDGSNEPSYFEVTGRTASGERVSEIVAVHDFDAAGLASVSSYTSGNLIEGPVTLDNAGRVVFSAQNDPGFDVQPDTPLAFTVKGTDIHGKTIQEVVTEPWWDSGVSFATGKYFKTVTEITANHAFTWNLEIGHTQPVDTVHEFVQVYGVAPVDELGNPLENNEMQSSGRIEFTVPKQFVIEGGHAGVRLSADMVNYIDTIEVLRSDVSGVKVDIGYDRVGSYYGEDGSDNFIVNALSNSSLTGSANTNVSDYGDWNAYTDNPVSYPDDVLAYAIFKVEAPSASAQTPVTLTFDIAQVGRYGIDTSSISYAPGGTWSTGLDSLEDNSGINLLLPVLRTEPVLNELTLDFFSSQGEYATDDIYSVKIDNYSYGVLYINAGTSGNPNWIEYDDYRYNVWDEDGDLIISRDDIEAGKLAYSGNYLFIGSYLYDSAESQQNDSSDYRYATGGQLTPIGIDFFSDLGGRNTAEIYSIYIDDTDDGTLYYNSGTAQAPNWEKYWDYKERVEEESGSDLYISRAEIEAGKLAYIGENDFEIEADFYASAEDQENDSYFDDWTSQAPPVAAPEPAMAEQRGSVALEGSGYIWIRYNNNDDSDNDGADRAFINNLHVDGGATLSIVGQKVIKDGVAMSQELGAAGELLLDGAAVSHRFALPDNFDGNLIVYVSSNEASAHLQNGVFRVVGQNANGDTVERYGSWGTTDYYGGWAGGFEDGQSIMLQGLGDLVSIESIRIGEFTEQLKDYAGWGEDSPYELYDPVLSFTTGNLTSLAENLEIPLNHANGYGEDVESEIKEFVPGAPVNPYPGGELKVGLPEYENILLDSDESTILNGYYLNGVARVVLTTTDNLNGRSFVITGRDTNDNELTETLTFVEGAGLVYTEAKFALVTSIVSSAGQSIGHVSVGQSYDYVASTGAPQVLMGMAWNPEEPSFTVSGFDTEGRFQQVTITDLRHTDQRVIGAFSEILAFQAESGFDDFELLFQPVPEGGFKEFVEIDLNKATRGNDGLIDLGGMQRVVISGGSASRGQRYMVKGEDAQGNAIEETIEGIAPATAVGEDWADDYPSSEYGATVYAITEHYFAKIDKILVTNWHIDEAETLPIVSIGTLGAPIAPDQSLSRYGQEAALGFPVASFDTASRLSFSSDDNLSDRVFTITGTLADGRTVTETVTGPNAGMALSAQAYMTVTRIVVDEGRSGAVKVGYVSSKGGLTDNFVITGSGTAEDPYQGYSTNTLESYLRYEDSSADNRDSEADVLLYVDFNGAAPGTVNLFYDLAVQGAPGKDTLYVEYSSNINSLLQGRVEFEHGDDEVTFVIPVVGDDTRESDESMTLTLTSSSAGTTVVDNKRTSDITIVNDDDQVTLSPTAKSSAEGNSSETDNVLRFTVSRMDTGTEKRVRWHLSGLSSEEGADENAADEEDFEFTSGVVTFAANALTATIEVAIKGDRVYEGTETFRLVLSEPEVGSGYSLGSNASALGTVTEDDVGIQITANQVSKNETDGQVSHTFTVTRVGDLSQASALRWSVSGTDSTDDIDVTAADFGGTIPTNQVLNFTAGQSSKTITVTTTGDNEMTGDSAFTVTLSNASGDTSDLLDGATAQGLILEYDAVNLSIGSGVRQKEGSLPESEKELTYTLTRADASQAASYNWQLLLEGDGVNLSASAADFAYGQDSLPSGTAVFAAGELTTTIKVRVANDNLIESDEAFKLQFEGVNAAGAASQKITAYLVNDTVAYSMQVKVAGEVIGSVSSGFAEGQTEEGEDGMTEVEVTFLRAGDSSSPVTLTYSLQGGDTHPMNAADFKDAQGNVLTGLPTNESITFDALQSSVTRIFRVSADSLKEENETFRIVLKNQASETVASQTVQVINDDAGLVLRAGQLERREESHSAGAPDQDTYSTLTYTVDRSGDLDQESTVNWSVKAQNGITGADFFGYNGALPSGTLTFEAGDADSKTFTIRVLQDWQYEGAFEDLVVELSNASVGTQIITATATTRILDDDKEVGFSLDSIDQTVTEDSPSVVTMVTDTDFVDLTYTVVRTGNDLNGQQSVTWTLSGDSRNGDAARVDSYDNFWGWSNTDVIGWIAVDNGYRRANTGTLRFDGNGDNVKTITIRVHKDHYQENPEAFKITLSDASPGLSVSATDGVATGLIEDDDIALVLDSSSATRVTQAEGQPSGGSNVYTEYSWVINREGVDAAVDLNWSVESHSVHLGSWVDAAGVYRYGWTPSVTVDSSDFKSDSLSGTLSFAAGESSKTLTIRVLGDEVVESTEAFLVKFTKPANVGDIRGLGIERGPTERYVEGVVLRDEGQFAIVGSELDIAAVSEYDPDEEETLDAASAKTEGDDGYVSHFFKIYRDFTTAGAASIEWRVEDGPVEVRTDASPFLNHAINTRASVDDFMPGQDALSPGNGLPSGRVTIPDGKSYVIIEIKTKADRTAEDLESFQVRLSNPSAGSTLSPYKPTSVGYLANDDHPLFSVGEIVPNGNNTLTSTSYGSKVVTEGDTVTYTVYRSGSTDHVALVDWAVVFPDPVTGESTSDTNSASNYTASASDFGTDVLGGVLTFGAGEASKVITLPIRADSSSESWAEAFSIELSNARWDASVPVQVRNASTPAISAVAGSMESIIVDGDAPMATVAVSAVTRSGNNAETPLFEGADRTITYTLTKTGAGAGQIAWKLALPPHNHLSGGDVTDIQGDTSAQLVQDGGRSYAVGLVAFAANEITKTVVVTLRNDGYVEDDENFVFTLIDGKTVLENGFDSGNSYQKLTSPWDTYGDGTQAANKHGIHFLDAAGNIPDSATLYRDPENYQVTTLVKNDDGIIVVNNVIAHQNDVGANVFEGDEGDNTVFTANITRSGRLDHDITVNYVVLDSDNEVIPGSAGTWTLSKDATVTDGNGSKTYALDFVLGQGDTAVGANQSFTIRLTGVSDPAVQFNQYTAANGGSATRDIPVTVVNDDTIWSISDGGSSTVQDESDGAAQYSFTITRPDTSGYYKGPATVTYKIVADNGAHTISSDDIVDGWGERTVFFDSGDTTKEVTFSVKGDQVAERNETFKVELVRATQGEIDAAHKAVSYTIVNDDSTFEISPALPQLEGDSSDLNYLEFNVVRKGQIESTSATVTWTVQDNAGDVTLASKTGGTLTFDAGSTDVTVSQDSGYGEQTRVVRVYIQGDEKPESGETALDAKIKVSLSAATNDHVIVTGKDIADGEILNDDASFSVTAGDVVKEGDALGQVFTISRTHLTAQDQKIHWSIEGAGQHAADSADFAGSMDGSVTFGSDDFSIEVFVAFSDDAQAEFDETFIFSISGDAGTSGDTITTASVDGTIENDDATLSVSFEEGNDRIREGSGSNTQMVEFVVTRNFNTDGEASATWTLSGAAVDAGLFAKISGDVSFAEGEDSQTVRVAVTPNAVFAGEKAFTVTLSAASGAQILVGQNHAAEATIVEDDSTIGIRGDAEVLELNNGSNAVQFVLERTGGVEFDSVVGWRVVKTTNGSNNAANADFVDGVLPSGTLTLDAGQTEFNLSVPGILGDLTFEGDETFRLELFNATSGDAGLSIHADHGTATGTILNNEARVEISSAVANYNNAVEHEEGSQIIFTVNRTGYLGIASSVTWDVAYKTEDKNGTGDFVSSGLPSGTVYFNAWESEKTITVNVRDDDVSELNEVFRVKLLTASEGTSIGAFNSFFKVMNNDADQITLSAGAQALAEGDGNAYTTHTFTLTRENPWIETSVDWAVEGSGSHALDVGRLLADSGTATFALGQLTTTIEVKVLRDDQGDFDREFTLSVSNPVTNDAMGAQLVNTSVRALVQNDDPAVSIGLTRASFVEGSGTNNRVIEFQVQRTGDTTGTARVDWTISSDGDNGTNIADFGGYWPTGFTVFNNGESLKTIQVALAPDAVFEPTEGFKVVLSNLVSSVTDASIVTSTATGTITNDDTGIFVDAALSELREGDAVDFTLSAQGLPNRTVKVYWVVEGFGLSPANADDFNQLDYPFDVEKQAYYSELRLDRDGEALEPITVSTMSDNVAGIDEDFRLRVVEVVGGTIAQGRAEVTILDDDSLVGISPASVVKSEGSDETTYTFTVTRTGDTSRSADVEYAVEGFGDNPATEDDFVSPWSGSVEFAIDQVRATIILTVNGDSDFESDESFVVRLTAPDVDSTVQIEPSAAMAVGVIENDDSASLIFKPLVAVVKEGTETQNFLSYEIIRNGDNSKALEVRYTITDGAEADFDEATGLEGTLVLEAGQSRAVLKLGIQPNGSAQENRSFSVAITAPEAPDFDAPEAISSTIVDDDSGISVALLSSETSTESQDVELVFVVTRQGVNLSATEVAWQLAGLGDNGVSVADLWDNQAMSGSLVFALGEVSKQVVVKVQSDDVAELTEALRLTLLSSSDDSQQILVSTADAYILDNDSVTSGNDVIQTGMGSDRIEADDGDDVVYAGGGADRVYGGDGDDTIHAQGGADVVFGEAGDDTVVLNFDNLDHFAESTDANSEGHAATYVNGGAGDDTLVFEGESLDIDLDHILEVGGVRNFETIVLADEEQTLALSIQSLTRMQTIRAADDPLALHISLESDVANANVSLNDLEDWSRSGVSEGYTVWTHVSLNATLYVDQRIIALD